MPADREQHDQGAGARRRVVHELAQRALVVGREGGVERAHDPADGRHGLALSGVGPDDQRERGRERRAGLRPRGGDEGEVRDGARRLLEAVVVHVAHLADDGVPAAAERADAPAERARARPVPLGEGAAHDRLVRRAGGVLRAERPAAAQRDAQRPEVVAVHVRDGVLGPAGVRPRPVVLHLDRHVVSVAAEGHPVGQRHVARPRDRPRLADQGLEEAQARGGAAVPGIGEEDAGGDHVAGVESGPHLAQAKEAARHQPRRGHQHDGQRDLRDHQGVAHPSRRAAAPRPGAGASKGLRDGRPARAEEREHAHEQRAEHGDPHREQQDRRVDTDVFQPRERQRRARVRHHPHGRRGQEHAGAAAQDAQQHGFAQHERDHPDEAGAERGTHGELRLRALGAHEQQPGHVGARDEEHEQHAPEHEPEQVRDGADDRIPQRLHVRRDVRSLPCRRRGVAPDVVAEVGEHAREVRLRGPGRHAAPEPSDPGEVERGGPRARRVEREREPDLHVARGIPEARRHDPDDRARDVVHHDLPAEGTGVAAEALLPDAVRHHDDPLGAGPVLARGEPPAERRANAQDVEEVRRDARAADANGGLARLRGAEVAVVEPPRGDAFEGARPVLVEQDHGVGLVHPLAPGVAHRMRQPREAVRFRVGERLEQDAVHQAEHGRRGADAERENEDHRSGEDRGAPEAARREPELGPGEQLAELGHPDTSPGQGA